MTSSNGNIFRVTGPFWIHRSSVDSAHKTQWCGTSVFSLIWAWSYSWANNRDAGDLRHHRALYDVTEMSIEIILFVIFQNADNAFPELPSHSGVLGCGDTTFPKAAPVQLPEELMDLNSAFATVDFKQLERRTRKQAQCQAWFTARKGRLTASRFAQVAKRREVDDMFLYKIFQRSFNATSSASDHGIRNEIHAKDAYVRKFNHTRHIHECGFVVNDSYKFLGATPDGKVCDGSICGILEIKCPFKARHMSIREAVASFPNFVLRDFDGVIGIKPWYDEYKQVQGQLMVTGAEFCDFIVYTFEDMFVQRIMPDYAVMDDLLNKLGHFYRMHAMRYLVVHNLVNDHYIR